VQNLVRPFTLRSFFEVLERTGKIVDSGVWINSIKSHAIVHVRNGGDCKCWHLAAFADGLLRAILNFTPGPDPGVKFIP
jgi:hypothetical protein